LRMINKMTFLKTPEVEGQVFGFSIFVSVFGSGNISSPMRQRKGCLCPQGAQGNECFSCLPRWPLESLSIFPCAALWTKSFSEGAGSNHS
jgi:hypothetical protein